jgi:hypothetical protein
MKVGHQADGRARHSFFVPFRGYSSAFQNSLLVRKDAHHFNQLICEKAAEIYA